MTDHVSPGIQNVAVPVRLMNLATELGMPERRDRTGSRPRASSEGCTKKFAQALSGASRYEKTRPKPDRVSSDVGKL